MKFTVLTEEEYNLYWENHPLKTFLSSSKIGILRKKSNWTVDYVGVKEDQKIVAATMLLGHKRHFNRYEFYSPRGFLLDFNNHELLDYFIKELKIYLKEKKAYVFRFDPYIINKQRDKDGNIIEDGLDNTPIKDKLLSLGFKQVPISDMEQVGWMFCLDLENKTEEDLLKDMKSNTRNIIKKTEKIGIDIKEITYEELDRFENILIETGKRKGFHTRDISYYQEMYKLFHDSGEVKFFITELNLKKYISNLEDEKKSKQEKLDSTKDTRHNKGQIATIKEDISTLEKRIADAKETMDKVNEDTITLSGSMFIFIQPEVVYLSSGNYQEYLKYNSQYLLQWKMIQCGLKNKFKRYNFYGIPANINTHPKDYGIYEFKRGFNGYVEELLGEFELPLSFHYHIFKLIHKIKKAK